MNIEENNAPLGLCVKSRPTTTKLLDWSQSKAYMEMGQGRHGYR